MGVGFKVVNGKRTTDLCIRFYVIHKLPKFLIAPVFQLPKSVDGIPTDIIESPPSVLLAKRKPSSPFKATTASVANSTQTPSNSPPASPPPTTQPAAVPPDDPDTLATKNRPYFGGVGAANIDVLGGTLGYFCHSIIPKDGQIQVYILSNSHVLGGFGGDPPDVAILQPSTINGGQFRDNIATYVRAAQIDFTPGAPNKVDAAIAAIADPTQLSLAVGGIGPLKGTADAVHNSTITKCGMSTGKTSGIITDISHSAQIPLDPGSPASSLSLIEQLYIEPADSCAFACPGDSGAIIVNSTQQAVGLLCAGDPNAGKWGIANRIANVTQALSIILI
jgi:hypothetical protein